jgi:starch phosphorylase
LTLRRAVNIPKHEIWGAHFKAKRRLIEFVNRQTNAGMDVDVFTIGFARRAAAYKRADLLFEEIARLRRIHAEAGPIQIIFAGKAHPNDGGAKELIRRVFQARHVLREEIKAAYLVDYDIDIGALMTSGVDLWLNTPEPPLEASGTSGMKAALNGVPSLSVLDGWWVEGCIEGVTGWAIGSADPRSPAPADRARTAGILYDKLDYVILPMFYRERDRFTEIMRHAIAVNGAFFNTHRMLQQYIARAYLR